jgi:hypothetical protein
MIEILKLPEELSRNRMNICYKCPLYSSKYGGLCNNELWLNKETGDVSTEQKEGYKRGCGCLLNSKTRISSAKCPLEKW